MPPYLDTVTSFVDVPITSAGVDTVAFLKASEGLLGLFDILNSAAFTPVQSDIKGNITKVRARYDIKHGTTPDSYSTLERLVEGEVDEEKRTATQGLMWLLRGLSLTCGALQETQADEKKELSTAFNSSYQLTLRKHHNFFVAKTFSLAMKACPYRADFYSKLVEDKSGGPPASEEQLNKQLNDWLAALGDIVKRMETFYKAGGHDKGF